MPSKGPNEGMTFMAGQTAQTAQPATSQNDPVAINRAARMNLIPRQGSQTVRRRQSIYNQSFANYVAGQNLSFIVPPAPVGIITRFLVHVTASIGQGNAETQTRTGLGGSAIFSNIQYVDTSNNTRINVPSWYLNILSTLRRRRLYGAALTSDINTIMGPGAAFTAGLFAVPATLTGAPPANGSPNYSAFFEIPLAYAHDDLRGAVQANLLQATQSLTFTINPNFFVTSTDVVNIAEAGYQSSSAQLGKISYLTVTIYQEYIDQFQGLALPMIDLGTQYILTVTGGYNPTQASDLIIPYANYRLFLSTLFRYNNAGTFNVGSDINWFSIRNAGNTDIVRSDPYTWTLLNREHVGDDLPAGYYTINHRDKPLFTNNSGNINLVINASSVTSINSVITCGYEQLQLLNALPAAGSIPSGS